MRRGPQEVGLAEKGDGPSAARCAKLRRVPAWISSERPAATVIAPASSGSSADRAGGPAVWLPLFGCAAAASLWAWRTRGLALDDFFITYRYAWNLAHGRGFVFNAGEPVFGLTCPGFGAALGLIGWLPGVDIPVLATLLYALALVGIAALLAIEDARLARPFVAVGALLAVASPFVWKSQGCEAAPALALLLLAARWSVARPATAGILAGAAVFLRPEAGLALALLGLLAWREARALPWRFAIAALAVLGAGAIACRLTFSTWLPLTLESKRSLAAIDGSSAHFWSDAAAIWQRHGGPWSGVLGVLGLAGFAVMVWRGGRAQRFLALWALTLLGAYSLLGVPFFVWYAMPIAVAVWCGAAAAFATLVHAAALAQAAALRRALVGLVVLLGAALAMNAVAHDARAWLGWSEDPRMAAYRAAAIWIRDHSDPHERIAYVEIGALAYWSDRPVDDLLGLVTPRSLPFVARRDLEGAFLTAPTDWVVHHDGRGRMRAVVRRDWFAAAYQEVFTVDSTDGGGRVHVYRRRPGSAVPPPRPPTALDEAPELPATPEAENVG